MASVRLQIALAIACASLTTMACAEGHDPATAPGSSASTAPSTVAPWVADANGPDLFEHVVERARSRAERPYRPPAHHLVEAAGDLDYAQYRDIRFRPEGSLWEGSPFEIQLFHPGGSSDVPVGIHLVEDGRSRRVGFDAGLFDYGDLVDAAALDLSPEAGYAGFKVLHAMNRPETMDEVAAFLGASYFRTVGPGQVYGLSARGLAVDVAEPTGEEFPDFVDFWLVRPEEGAASFTFYGLLDGPSVAGAYRFELVPGQPEAGGTAMAVDARLFLRRGVRKLGVAPLTSMYLHSPLVPAAHDDVRPRVHDSQGLLMLTADGEWIWRPLTNGPGVRVTSLRDVDPSGFALVQRARDFEQYLDLEALYHRRPSLWVAIDEAWGSGGVELLEIPTASEFNDNVVAYWSPDGGAAAGDELRFRYRLVTFDARLEGDRAEVGRPEGEARDPADVPTQTLAWVARTRIGWDALPGEVDPPPRSRRRVVVDFVGGGLASLGGRAEPAARLSTSSGEIADLRVQRLPDGGRRATFALIPEGDRGADMRLFLEVADTAVTETWSYLWEPALVR